MTNSAFVPWSAILCFGNHLYCEAQRAMAIKLLNIYFCVSRNRVELVAPAANAIRDLYSL